MASKKVDFVAAWLNTQPARLYSIMFGQLWLIGYLTQPTDSVQRNIGRLIHFTYSVVWDKYKFGPMRQV